MTTALTPEQRIAELVDDYAESRHVNGRHTYSQKTGLAACKRDAERYRWLREQDDDNFCFAVVKNPHFDVYLSPEELDAAIDSAMATQEKA